MNSAPATARRRLLSEDRRAGLTLVAAMAAVMWVVEVIDVADHHHLDAGGGIVARQVSGLDGVIFSPFLHASFGHLLSNTVPFLVLGAMIALRGLVNVALVTVIVALVAGLGTWLTGPSNSVTIGASGIVFGYAAYLLARGIFSRRWTELGVGLLVALIWGGSLLWSLIPRDHVSWQAHLFGAIGGILAARWLAARSARSPDSAAKGRSAAALRG